jgi:hypothetical protein
VRLATTEAVLTVEQNAGSARVMVPRLDDHEIVVFELN